MYAIEWLQKRVGVTPSGSSLWTNSSSMNRERSNEEICFLCPALTAVLPCRENRGGYPHISLREIESAFLPIGDSDSSLLEEFDAPSLAIVNRLECVEPVRVRWIRFPPKGADV